MAISEGIKELTVTTSPEVLAQVSVDADTNEVHLPTVIQQEIQEQLDRDPDVARRLNTLAVEGLARTFGWDYPRELFTAITEVDGETSVASD